MYTEAWGTEVLRAFLYLGLPVAWGRGWQWKCVSISRPRDVGPGRPEASFRRVKARPRANKEWRAEKLNPVQKVVARPRK